MEFSPSSFNTSSKDTNSATIANQPFNSLQTLPQNLLLEIFRQFQIEELPNLFLVCHRFHQIGSKSTLVEGEIDAWRAANLAAASCLDHSDLHYQAINEIETFWKDKPWLAMQGFANYFKKFLEELTFEQLAQLELPLDFDQAPLAKKHITRILQDTWKSKIQLRTHHGFLSLDWWMKFNETAFDQFIHMVIKENSVQILTITSCLAGKQLQVIGDKLASNQLMIEELNLYADPDQSFNRANLRRFFESLSTNSGLKRLMIKHAMLQDEEINALSQALENHESIELLSIQGFAFSDLGMQDLLHLLQSNSHIKELRLIGWREDELNPLFEGLNLSHLEKLILNRGTLSEDGAVVLANTLRSNVTLRSVDLLQNEIEAGAEQHLMNAFKQNKTIENYSIPNTVW